MADFKPGDTVYAEFTTQVAGGTATNADSVPLGTVNHNGSDDTVAVTVTNLDAGRYKAVFVLPATYIPGDVVNLTVSATISGTASKGVVLQPIKLGTINLTPYIVSAAVWIDTVNGTSGTVVGTNGIQSTPSNSIANATTIAAALPVKRFQVLPNSTITLAQSYSGYLFSGEQWFLALGGQDVSLCTVNGATVTGVGNASVGIPVFSNCSIGTATIAASHYNACGMAGTLSTSSVGGTFNLIGCYNEGGETIDFQTAHSAVTFNCRDWSGGITFRHVKAGDTAVVDGLGNITIDSTCTGGTFSFHGGINLTTNSTSVTVTQTPPIANATQIGSVSTGAVGAVGGPLGAGMVNSGTTTFVGGPIFEGPVVLMEGMNVAANSTTGAIEILNTSSGPGIRCMSVNGDGQVIVGKATYSSQKYGGSGNGVTMIGNNGPDLQLHTISDGGGVIFNGDVEMLGSLQIDGSLNADGGMTLGSLAINGDSNLGGYVHIQDYFGVTGDFWVLGDSSFNDWYQVGDYITFGSTSFGGPVIYHDSVTMTKGLFTDLHGRITGDGTTLFVGIGVEVGNPTGTLNVNAASVGGQTANASGPITFPSSIASATALATVQTTVNGTATIVSANLDTTVSSRASTSLVSAVGAEVVALGSPMQAGSPVSLAVNGADSSAFTANAVIRLQGGLATAAELGSVTLSAFGVDPIIIETGIAASAGLVNDASTQLTAINLRQVAALVASVLAGKLTGGGTPSISTAPVGNPTVGFNRVSTTGDDSYGNRPVVNLRVPT